MAIFSLHHSSIGKTTQARPHTAAAHVRYITRKNALHQLEQARLPEGRGALQAYFRDAEDGDRKNARVADKVMLALPRELSPEQRVALVRGYAEEVTGGRAPWLAAFHDNGEGAHNPHCHLVLRDRDPVTGKRVMQLSEAGSTDRLRTLWESHANQALAGARQAERVDRRSNRARGLEETPTIHEGPNSRAMDARGARPVSRERMQRNRPKSRRPGRTVDYPRIDRGRTRPQYNRDREVWAAMDRDRAAREHAALRPLQQPGEHEGARTRLPAFLLRGLHGAPLAPPDSRWRPPRVRQRERVPDRERDLDD